MSAPRLLAAAVRLWLRGCGDVVVAAAVGLCGRGCAAEWLRDCALRSWGCRCAAMALAVRLGCYGRGFRGTCFESICQCQDAEAGN